LQGFRAAPSLRIFSAERTTGGSRSAVELRAAGTRASRPRARSDSSGRWPDGRVAAGDRRHRAASHLCAACFDGSGPYRPPSRPCTATGAHGGPSERALPRTRAGGTVCGYAPAGACSSAQGDGRRGALGTARPQPGRPGGPASGRAVEGAGVDSERARPLPRPCAGRPPLRALAAGSDQRNAPR
jgi:hypothetical protein